MRVPIRTPVLLGLVAVVCVPDSGSGFGTVNAIGQQAEHERITRAALACRAGRQPPACFEPRSLDQLAGVGWRLGVVSIVEPGTFGAVGAPDMLPQEPAQAHCDEADFIDTPGYPRSREQATTILMRCRAYVLKRISEGVAGADGLLKGGVVAALQVNLLVGCQFWPRSIQSGRRKCVALQGFGRALHTVQDFYAHTNWADVADPRRPESTANPPGLARSDLPTLLNIRLKDAAVMIPRGLSSGCFEKRELVGAAPNVCRGRVRHADLNKDTGLIDPVSGLASEPLTARGRVGNNFQRAVRLAIRDTRRLWNDYRWKLVQTYGEERAEMMACALTRDDPVTRCKGRDPAPVACLSPWQGTWTRVEHPGTMRISVEQGKLRFRFTWPWQTGEFTNLQVSGRTMTGEEIKAKPSSFKIVLAADGNAFAGTWKWKDGSGEGMFTAKRAGANPCSGPAWRTKSRI